jgi:hypothetical protein
VKCENKTIVGLKQNNFKLKHSLQSMQHQEIRYRILFILYLKHYSDQLGQPQVTNKVIEEAGLEYVEKNMVYGDIVYLKESNLITGTNVLGQAYPYTLIITSRGIDRVEKMIKDFIQFLKQHDNEELRIKYRSLDAMGISSGVSTAMLLEIKGIMDQYRGEFAKFINGISEKY